MPPRPAIKLMPRAERRQGMTRDLLRERFHADQEEAWHWSALGRWMAQNHDELTAILDRRNTDWQDVAESFRLAGLRDLNVKLPSAEIARETWRRVHERQTGDRTARALPRRPV